MAQRQFQSNATGSGRTKVALPRGKSLMDWIRLGQSGVDLKGTGGRLLSVTPEQLVKHDKPNDCWMAIGGRVYNISQYNSFHPGGVPEIMKGAGKDATHLFNEVHRWVNYESMLKHCLVGRLVAGSGLMKAPPQFGNLLAPPRTQMTTLSTVNTPQKQTQYPQFLSIGNQSPSPNRTASNQSPSSNTTVAIQTSLPLLEGTQKAAEPNKPRYDFHQTSNTVTVSVYTRIAGLDSERVVVTRPDGGVRISVVLLDGRTFILHFEPEKPIHFDCTVKSKSSIGKVEVEFTKCDTGVTWSRLGTFLSNHNSCLPADQDVEKISCIVTEKSQLTRDSLYFRLSLPEGAYMEVPCGKHVRLYQTVSDMEIVQSYTPVLPFAKNEKDSTGTQVEFLIKIYSDGTLTPQLSLLSPGDEIQMSKWTGHFELSMLGKAQSVLLVAAGTGITPMIRLIQYGLAHNLKITLLYYNKTQQDIIWRQELDNVQKRHNELFSVTHILSQPDDNWDGLTGHINLEHLRPFISRIDDIESLWAAVCGPLPFNKLSKDLLEEVGLATDRFHMFEG